MVVTLLGTGADHCIPAFRCTCPVCQDAREQGINRQNSCAAIEIDPENVMLVDMPPQIMLMLKNYSILDTSIKNVLITHRHADHTLGLRYLFHGKHEKGFSVDEPVNLYIPRPAFEAVSRRINSDKEDIKLHPVSTDFYKIHFIEAYKSFTVSGISITPVETGHLLAKFARDNGLEEIPKSYEQVNDPSLGFIFDLPGGRRFGYLLDASMRFPGKTIEILESKKLDYLVLECTYSHESWYTGHFDVEGVIDFYERYRPGWMTVSHVSHKNLTYKELEEKLGKYGIKLSYDGMEFTI